LIAFVQKASTKSSPNKADMKMTAGASTKRLSAPLIAEVAAKIIIHPVILRPHLSGNG
jgi:hypothetical protein